MKKMIYVLCISVFLRMFTACNIDDTDSILDTAENIVDSQPDSALILLDSINNPYNKTDEQRARHSVLTLYARDMSGKDISKDTIITMIIYARDYLKTADNPKYLAFAEYYLGRIYQAQGNDEQFFAEKHERQRYDML